MPSSHVILCRPLFLLLPIPPSIKVFFNELTLRMRWPKYWSFSFSISPSNESLELIFFRIDWFDLLAVQGTLRSLLQHHSLKASILQHSAFFTVQLSQPNMHAAKYSNAASVTLPTASQACCIPLCRKENVNALSDFPKVTKVELEVEIRPASKNSLFNLYTESIPKGLFHKPCINT